MASIPPCSWFPCQIDTSDLYSTKFQKLENSGWNSLNLFFVSSGGLLAPTSWVADLVDLLLVDELCFLQIGQIFCHWVPSSILLYGRWLWWHHCEILRDKGVWFVTLFSSKLEGWPPGRWTSIHGEHFFLPGVRLPSFIIDHISWTHFCLFSCLVWKCLACTIWYLPWLFLFETRCISFVGITHSACTPSLVYVGPILCLVRCADFSLWTSPRDSLVALAHKVVLLIKN